MSDLAILAEGVSKEYRLGVLNHGTLYRDLQSWWARSRGRPDPNRPIYDTSHGGGPRASGDLFRALEDVSFSVGRGDIVGVIGHNGAGKSTLLKVISRITAPTRGSISLKGRVASLLEVGTGFHPELTGRENVYLNGAILGMNRREVARKFDEIVEFAEISEFIDTPVKRYSSGMYVRLAFAVAAHLESEILLVDEVLAVGDVRFQRKCLGKMEDVSSGGRTIVFVSHNMAAVEHLCRTSLVLADGRIAFSGDVHAGIQVYLEQSMQHGDGNLATAKRDGDGRARIVEIFFTDPAGRRLGILQCGTDVQLHVVVEKAASRLRNVSLAAGITTLSGDGIVNLSTELTGLDVADLPDRAVFRCDIPRLPVRGGSYALNLYMTAGGAVVDWVRDAYRFQVEDADFFGTGRMPPVGYSTFVAAHSWSVHS